MAKVIVPRSGPSRVGRVASWRVPFTLGQVLVAALVLVVGFLVLYPMVMLLLGSVAPPRGSDELFSLAGYANALSDPEAQSAIVTTLWLSFVRAALAVGLAVFIAWALTRTNVPGRRIFHYLALLGFFLPLLPQILAWTVMLSPRSGIVNVWLRSLLGTSATTGPFNVYSYEGIIFLSVIGWSGFLYLFISPAFRAVDSALEEAARMAGASSFRTMMRITVPLLAPTVLGAFGLAFIRMLESFEIELFVGTPAKIYVFTTQIYDYITYEITPNYPTAIALSTVFVFLTMAFLVIQGRLLGARSYVTVGGKNYRQTPSDIGRWKYVVCGVLVVYNLIVVVLPFVVLVLASFQQSSQFRLDAFTLNHWKTLGRPDILGPIWNTILTALVSSTVAISLIGLISYVVVRTRFKLRRALDVFTWVPYMVPSFVLGVGFLWAALKGIPMPFVLYGSLGLLVIAFVVRLLPIGSRLMNGTMVQLSTELEEAARIAGASWTSTFRKIVLPLLRPAFVMGWLLFMVIVVRELSTVILLYGTESQLLSIVFYSLWHDGNYANATVIGLLMTGVGILVAIASVLLERYSHGTARIGH